MNIDWEDEIPGMEPEKGSTDITVVQPLVEGGYTFFMGQGDWTVSLKISLGFEINVNTKGEEVGDGPISLLGVTLSKRLIK